MAIGSSMFIGRSALEASQVAIQVAGNNLANAATPGYSRQRAVLVPERGQMLGNNTYIGRGVRTAGVQREVDEALQQRLWAGVSQEQAASTRLGLLSQVEATLNELSEADLSSELSRFFNSWSELANSPSETAPRALVVQQGVTLAASIRTLRDDLMEVRTQVDRQLAAQVTRADELLSQIAQMNQEVTRAERGSGQAGGLRDRRDELITELSTLMDISAVSQADGTVEVLVGSTPVVIGSRSRGLDFTRRSVDGTVEASIAVRERRAELSVEGGSIGALMEQRQTLVERTLDVVDDIAGQLIWEVNKIHSSGYGTASVASLTGTLGMTGDDPARALNDPANGATRDLPFAPRSGSFIVRVTNSATGESRTAEIAVDLDGITASGAAGFGDDTSVEDLASALSGVENLSARVNPDGTLRLDAAPGFTVAVEEDSSGALALLGINTFFTGRGSADIAVRAELERTPGLVSVGRTSAGQRVDNDAAKAVAALQDVRLGTLGGSSLREAWSTEVQSIGVQSGSAQIRAEAATLVRESLDAQRSAISGVSIDEEMMNLLTFQRQYEGAARFISTVDQLTQTLINIV